MKGSAHMVAALLCAAFAASPGEGQAAELQVIAGSGIAAPLNEIAAQFEKATGHKVAIRYGTAPQLMQMATTTPFDLGIVPREVLKNQAARAQFPAGDTPDLARIGIGVAVKKGAPKPDMGTPETLKTALLGARGISSLPASATGVQLAGVYERLGIAEEMKAKIKPAATPQGIVEAVANGEAQLGVFILNVLTDPRLDIVGPLPGDLQREVVYTGGVAVNAKEVEAAKAFFDYFRSPASAAVIKAKGMTPG